MKFALTLLQMFRLLQSFKQFGNIWKISNTTEKLFVTGFKRKILKTLSLQRKILFVYLFIFWHFSDILSCSQKERPRTSFISYLLGNFYSNFSCLIFCSAVIFNTWPFLFLSIRLGLAPGLSRCAQHFAASSVCLGFSWSRSLAILTFPSNYNKSCSKGKNVF